MSIPVGSHPLHAAGMAMAISYRKLSEAVICYFGDGATSEGDFHEAMTFAGVRRAPVIFFCQNNAWAISVPRKSQCAAESRITSYNVCYTKLLRFFLHILDAFLFRP